MTRRELSLHTTPLHDAMRDADDADDADATPTTAATITSSSPQNAAANAAAADIDDGAKSYLESTVTRALHDGLCALNAARPDEPLVFLAQYLLDVAAKTKTTTTTTTTMTREGDDAA